MYIKQISSDAKNCILNFSALLADCIHHRSNQEETWYYKDGNDEYFCSNVPYPLMNGLISYASDNDTILKKLNKLSKMFNHINIPVTWFWPHDRAIPKSTMQLFKSNHYIPMGQYTSFSAMPEDVLGKPLELEANHSIEEVKNKEAFYAFMQITKEAFSVPDEGVKPLTALYSAYRTSDKLKLFIAKSDDEYVATLASFNNNSQLGLYNASTKKRYRNQGFLKSLIKKAAEEAGSCEIIFAQLMATQQARGLCEYFNARELAHFTPLCSGFDIEQITT